MYRSQVGHRARLRVSADGEIHLNLPIPAYYLLYQLSPVPHPPNRLTQFHSVAQLHNPGGTNPSSQLASPQCRRPNAKFRANERRDNPISQPPTRRQVRRRERPMQSRPRVCFTAIVDVRNEHRSFAHAELHHSRVAHSTSLSARLSHRCHELAYPKHPMPRWKLATHRKTKKPRFRSIWQRTSGNLRKLSVFRRT